MNEDGTPTEAQEPNVETPVTEAPEGDEETGSVTPEEVAKLLHLEAPTTVETEDEEEAEDTEEEEEVVNTDVPEDAEEVATEDEPEKVEDAEVPTFELEVEDEEGNKVTLKPGDDLEEVLKDFVPKSNGQIFAILEKLSDLKAEKAQYEAEQSKKAEETELAEAQAKVEADWAKEIKELQGSKRLEVTTGKNERVDAVFEFMSKENEKRIETGKPLLRSFEDALDKLELQETREAATKKAKEEKELARKRGGTVGGASAPATSGAPVYSGGARNANEALRSMKIL